MIQRLTPGQAQMVTQAIAYAFGGFTVRVVLVA